MVGAAAPKKVVVVGTRTPLAPPLLAVEEGMASGDRAANAAWGADWAEGLEASQVARACDASVPSQGP